MRFVRWITVAMSIAALAGCATTPNARVQDDSPVRYHPLLDAEGPLFPWGGLWPPEPEYPPAEPLPIIPLGTLK